MKSAQRDALALAHDQVFGTQLTAGAPSSSVAAIRLDPQGRISNATASAAAMLGFEPQELCGRSLKDLAIEGWQAAADVAVAGVRFGVTESFELALKGRSGRRTLVEMTARAGADGEDGALIAWSERRMRRNGAGRDDDSERKRFASGLLRSQEAERMRIASELHDEIAPIVIMVKYMIEDAAGKIGSGVPADLAKSLSDAALHLRDVNSELHRISTDLRPRLLDDLGLIPTLEWHCRRVDEAGRGVRVEFQAKLAESDIPGPLKLDIFRIVQEALKNVIEHARARHAQVCLYMAMDELCVMIEDDGEGFRLDTASAKQADGLQIGLQSIRRRVEATGGRLLLESNRHRGTRIGGAWRLELTGAEKD